MKIKSVTMLAIAPILSLALVTACTNPCAAKEKPAGDRTENPCAAKENPCAAKENPCAAKENPCAAKENPCAAK
ncbi:MAG: hypothetical protein QNJ54_00965 [Prochloraceae cyanobacterium]|nr:hypothetical protein [Prochloraceae cyanobacterium]